jgi:sn-glycerol 3-phosphate transport system substrate-binding protein
MPVPAMPVSAHPSRRRSRPSRLHRRRQRLVVLLAIAGLGAAACSPPPSSGKRTETVDKDTLPECPLEALEKATEPVEITLWYGGLAGPTDQNLKDQAAGFNASQDKVVVKVEYQGKSYDEVLRKFEPATDDQRPPLVYLENTALRRLVDGGDIFPAEACMRADDFDLDQIKSAVRSYYTVNDVYWPGFVNVSEPVLYYNAVHFQRAGLDPEKPPQTLEELRSVAETLKADGVERPLALIMNAWFTESWLNGVGVDVVNESNGRDDSPTKASFNTDEAVDLFNFLKKMKDDGLLEPFSATDGQINQYLAVANQKSSMTLETSTAATTIKAFRNGDLDAGDLGVGGAPAFDNTKLVPLAGPFPGIEKPGKVRTGGAGFFITEAASPEEKAAGWRFMQYMLEPAQGIAWHKVGSYLPWLDSVVDSPEVEKFWAEEYDGGMLKIATEQLDDIDPFQPGPLMGPYPEYTEAIKSAFDEVMFKDADPEKALAEAEERVNEALERYNG